MGTDIHLAVEVRKNGIWTNATPFTEEEGFLSNYPNGYFESRNYDLFSMLANVRNGVGFAGVPTGGGFIPLTNERGIPYDASPDVRKWAEDGDHSHSYCTVEELLNYDWTLKTTKTGIVTTLKEIARTRLHGRPESWSGGIMGEGIEVFDISHQKLSDAICVTAEKYGLSETGLMHEVCRSTGHQYCPDDAPLAVIGFHNSLRSKFQCDRPCFRVTWQVSYYEQANEFLAETMPKLWRLGTPENVRLVMWFDS